MNWNIKYISAAVMSRSNNIAGDQYVFLHPLIYGCLFYIYNFISIRLTNSSFIFQYSIMAITLSIFWVILQVFELIYDQ